MKMVKWIEVQLKIVDSITEKVNKIIALYVQVKEKNKRLELENEKLQQKIETLEIEKKTVEDQYNTLKIGRAIMGNNENVFESKKKIEKLVREIDDCIAFLNK